MFNGHLFNKHLTKACLAAVFALGLTACSSSSDTSSTTTPSPDSGPTVAELQAEINAVRTQLGLPEDASLSDSIASLQAELKRLQGAAEEKRRQAEAEKAAAMAATAAKLYAGFGDDPLRTTGDGARIAVYRSAGHITVLFDPAGNDNSLSEDEDAMVAAHRGWEGKLHTTVLEPDTQLQGTVEAVIYSNVQAPTMGKKFGSAAAVTPTGAYQYQLVDGALNNANGLTDANAARVALTGVTRTAGTETFKLPVPNPGGATIINVPGSFHGVSGTYSCTPTTPANGCTASVAATMGFTLGGGAWTFAPSDANARVSEAADEDYASYGWWIYEPQNGSVVPFFVRPFHGFRGTAGAVDIANLVAGTATYVGGAAGQYALTSSTGGTNDGGQFTATATLRAKFGDATAGNTITGTIDNFMGADEMPRDWSVELNETTVGNDGVIAALTADATVWAIGDAGADASGEWFGNLREEGDDGVPMVATGVFYTEYGSAGKMIGGFGANKQ